MTLEMVHFRRLTIIQYGHGSRRETIMLRHIVYFPNLVGRTVAERSGPPGCHIYVDFLGHGNEEDMAH